MNFLGKIVKCSSNAFGIQFDSMKKNCWFNFSNTYLLYTKHDVTLPFNGDRTLSPWCENSAYMIQN